MRFPDSIEQYSEAEHFFYLRPYDKNESPLLVGTEAVPVTRFAEPVFVGNQHAYLRGLLLGRLARIHQLTDGVDESTVDNLGRMLRELLEAGYAPRRLRTALGALQQAWAKPAIDVLTSVLREIED